MGDEMKITVVIDMDDLDTEFEGQSVAAIVRTELRALLQAELRKFLKEDPQLQKALRDWKAAALEGSLAVMVNRSDNVP